MGDETTRSNNNPGTVLRLEDLRKAKHEQNDHDLPARVHVEVTCREPAGELIRKRVSQVFESTACLIAADEKPDWILSVIAFGQGELVEMSIILRRLFRSTLPGTEVESLDSCGNARLRPGGWLYESLRFHGLFGVRKDDLEPFLTRLATDLATQNWGEQTHKTAASTLKRMEIDPHSQ